jgi:hypothetical protein
LNSGNALYQKIGRHAPENLHLRQEAANDLSPFPTLGVPFGLNEIYFLTRVHDKAKDLSIK